LFQLVIDFFYGLGFSLAYLRAVQGDYHKVSIRRCYPGGGTQNRCPSPVRTQELPFYVGFSNFIVIPIRYRSPCQNLTINANHLKPGFFCAYALAYINL
jgi:hypothetical protein